MDSDQALRLLGKYSRWQMRSYFLYALGFSVPFAWMLMGIVFIGDTPPYRCALPPNATLNETIPFEVISGKIVYETCVMYANISVDNTTVPCQYGYWYDPEGGYDSTLTTEWDLVCGKEWLVELSMTVSSIGSTIGALVFNRLADNYGRKMVYLGCLWSNIAVATAMALSPNIIFYQVLSVIDGFQQQGMVATSFVMGIELFPTEQRTFAGNAVELFYAVGYISLVPIAYLIRNWRYLLLAITLPMLLTISFYWLLSESIPWLVANGKTKKAEAVLRKAAKFSKVTLPEGNIFDLSSENSELIPLQNPIDNEVGIKHKDSTGETVENKETVLLNTNEKSHEKNDVSIENEVIIKQGGGISFSGSDGIIKSKSSVHIEDKMYSVMDIFRHRLTRKYSLVMFFLWFINALAYFSINYTVTYLPGDRYVNMLLYSILEIPSYGLTWILSDKVGRRLPLVIMHVIGGVAMIGTFLQAFVTSEPLIITLSLIGKLMITASFALIYIVCPEVYPTNVRSTGIGMCSVFARLASFLSPFARTLHRMIPWLPPMICGVLSVIAGLLALLLPETRHTKLPDTIAEMEEWENMKNNPQNN